MLAMLIGCGLRRGELLALDLESLQRREEHWVIADPVGKGGHVRTVPIPARVKDTVDAWSRRGNCTAACSVRSTRRATCGATDDAQGDLGLVKAAAAHADIVKLARMTYAAPARGRAIWPEASSTRFSFSWGMRRSRRRNATWDANKSCACAVNDRLGIEPEGVA